MSTEQFYRFLYLVVWPFFNLFHPVRTVGREHIPEGAAVICPNHTALSDPFFVAFAFQKKNPLPGDGQDPADAGARDRLAAGQGGHLRSGPGPCGHARGQDGSALPERGAQAAHLPRGDPRGRRGRTWTPRRERPCLPPDGGAIVPMYIPAQKHWFRPTTVVIGEPYYPQIQGRRATAEENQEIAREIMRRIHALGGLPQ